MSIRSGVKSCLVVIAMFQWPPAPSRAADLSPRPNAWGREQAAHLLRRAGFGGTPEEIDALAAMGRRKAVDSLLNYESTRSNATRPPVERMEPVERAAMRLASEDERQKIRQERMAKDQVQMHLLRRWWIQQMIETPRPLEEKMTLFWHGHFTSGAREVKSAYMLSRQNELFRANATGNFRTLLMEVSKDPAMLLYLNNAQSNFRHPNENYARELMELFTMGRGNYTEKDVQEAARAFTGWSIDRDTEKFLYRPRQHDTGRKTVLGVSGNLNGGDVIDIIVSKPKTAENMARKLWLFFAGDDPPKAVVGYLANVFRKNNYEVKPVLRAMFLHNAFYAPAVMNSHVKSPVELLVGTMRSLETKPIDLDGMVVGLRLMGQDLFQPPNVKGWDGGLTWINTATLYNRYNVAGRLISGSGGRGRGLGEMMVMRAAGDDPELRERAKPTGAQPAFDPMPIVRAHKLGTTEEIVDHFVDRLIGRPMSPERRALLVETLESSLKNTEEPASSENTDAIRELIMLIVATPEYQLS